MPIALPADSGLVLREVADRVGITERAVQRIVQDLEAGGFVRRERLGCRNQYQVLVSEWLRHPIESHRKIGDLLKLITRERGRFAVHFLVQDSSANHHVAIAANSVVHADCNPTISIWSCPD